MDRRYKFMQKQLREHAQLVFNSIMKGKKKMELEKVMMALAHLKVAEQNLINAFADLNSFESMQMNDDQRKAANLIHNQLHGLKMQLRFVKKALEELK